MPPEPAAASRYSTRDAARRRSRHWNVTETAVFPVAGTVHFVLSPTTGVHPYQLLTLNPVDGDAVRVTGTFGVIAPAQVPPNAEHPTIGPPVTDPPVERARTISE